MAQKPNSGNKENVLLDDDASNIATESVESSKKPQNKKQDSNKTQQQQNGKQAKKSNGKSSPKNQRKTNESKGSEKNELNEQASSVTSPVLKESYASKFGSLSNEAKTNAAPSSRPKGPPTNSNTTKSTPPAKSNTLPAPRPLMSQVINLPVNKMDEVNASQPISFSETVKKAATESSSVPTSPKSAEGIQSSANSVSPPPPTTPTKPLQTNTTTIENEKEKTNS